MRFYRNWSLWFTFLLFAFVSLLISSSFDYSPTTRLVPLLVLIFTLIMLIFCLIGEFFPKLISRAVSGLDIIGQPASAVEVSSSQAEEITQRKKQLITAGWLIGFCTLLFLIGFRIATPIAIFLFLKAVSRQSWLKSLAITIVISAFIYVVFEVLFKFGLFRGILFGEIVIL